MTELRSALYGASFEMSGIRDRGERRAAIAEALGQLIPSDSTGWVAWSAEAPAIIARWPENAAAQRTLGGHIASLAHPVLRAIRAGRGLEPMRLSDLTDTTGSRRSAVLDDLYRVMGARHQLTFPALRAPDGSFSTWALHRASVDFDDDELALAAHVAPLLSLVERGAWRSTSSAASDVLTARECGILRLLADGLTTAQIGYVERISARTAAKHIEHIYAKLDVHDRASATRAAARLGLLAP
ncbi:helix-turn-helix transcriptional regulator [Gryllotalpicola protaetiae]|nr:LuxR C-terminal-related transcriptional regulator [Gryllotalpicola protaetiae]